MCTLVLVLVQHVSAVRHLQVLCFYLLAETAALLYFVFICPHGCHFCMIKSYIKSVTLVKIGKITCFIRSLNLGQYFHISNFSKPSLFNRLSADFQYPPAV
jgi:hypothetical protein